MYNRHYYTSYYIINVSIALVFGVLLPYLFLIDLARGLSVLSIFLKNQYLVLLIFSHFLILFVVFYLIGNFYFIWGSNFPQFEQWDPLHELFPPFIDYFLFFFGTQKKMLLVHLVLSVPQLRNDLFLKGDTYRPLTPTNSIYKWKLHVKNSFVSKFDDEHINKC